MHQARRTSVGETVRRRTSRRSEIEPFLVMQVLAAANARAAAGEEVLHLEVGEPSGGPPALAIAAAQAALTGHALGYSEALGLRPLLQGAGQALGKPDGREPGLRGSLHRRPGIQRNTPGGHG